MFDIRKIVYPELNPLYMLRPNPHIALGNEIFWTAKEDGLQVGVYLDDQNDVQCRSHRMPTLSDNFRDPFLEVPELPAIREMLLNAKQWNDTYVVFGEYLIKDQVSPARTYTPDRDAFIIFDIWSTKHRRFLNYNGVYQQCYQFKTPVVDLFGTCNVVNLDTLYQFKDKMLDVARERGKEGVVAKIYRRDGSHIFFKEKLDRIPIEQYPRLIEEGKIELPDLPASEIYGAITKAFYDLGPDQFDRKEVALPLVAQYVADECRKHNCRPVKNLATYYDLRVRELKRG